jgi:hypothetical protein
MEVSGEIRLSSTTMRRMPVLAQGQAPSPDGCYGCLAQITVTAASTGSTGLSGSDYLGAGLGAYSALTDSFYTTVGISSRSVLGIQVGLPKLLIDIPGGVGAAIGVFQTLNAYNNGNYQEASEDGGATLGGIAGAEVGAGIGAVVGFGVFDPITVPAGGIIGGIYGAYKGGQLGGAIYNSGFMPIDQALPSTPMPLPY